MRARSKMFLRVKFLFRGLRRNRGQGKQQVLLGLFPSHILSRNYGSINFAEVLSHFSFRWNFWSSTSSFRVSRFHRRRGKKLVYHTKRVLMGTRERERERRNGLEVGKWPRNSEWIALTLLCFRCGYSYKISFNIFFVLRVKINWIFNIGNKSSLKLRCEDGKLKQSRGMWCGNCCGFWIGRLLKQAGKTNMTKQAFKVF